MKGILVKANGTIAEMEFASARVISESVGGATERSPILDDNELVCGQNSRLPINHIASCILDRTIYGNVVIARNAAPFPGVYTIGLDDMDVRQLALLLDDASQKLEAKEKAARQCG